MRNHKNIQQWKMMLGASLLAAAFVFPANVPAASQGSLSSITEESQILPLPDGSGKYLLKSDGFYCLNADGTVDGSPSVHYFEHFMVDGTELHGFYYHDESGKFKAGSPHVVHLTNLQAVVNISEKYNYLTEFDGYYMVNNLGRLNAASQVRYMDNLVIDGKTFNGYYYFDEYGKMVTEPGIHYLDMDAHGQSFEGNYYFGGPDGALIQESGLTEDGLLVDENGRLDMSDLGMEGLEPRLEELLAGYDGEWSVYVKDVETGEEIVLNNKPLYSASLIKVFVLAKTYEDMETVKENEGLKIKAAPESPEAETKVDNLLWNMITVSDNESFNELVRLQTDKNDFIEGAKDINEYLSKEKYEDTSVQHTLAPSSSPSVGIGDNNITSVKDCGLLLERIYKGECVSEEASEEMLNLLLNQENTTKIPTGLPKGIQAANKTGETNQDQHDIAIVYGEKTDYILCVMSENCPNTDTAVGNIRSISKLVYNFLNLYEYVQN